MSVYLRDISVKIHPIDSDRDVQPESQLYVVLGGEMDIWRQRQVLQRDADTDRWTLKDPIYLSALDEGWEITIRFIETSRILKNIRFRRDQLSTTDMQQEINTKSWTMSFQAGQVHSPDLSLPNAINEGDIHLLLEDYIHDVRFGQIVDNTSVLHEAILSLPNQHPSKALFLNVLGKIWEINHFLSKDRDDINIAITLMQEALSYRLEEDPLGAFYAFHLAETFHYVINESDPTGLDKCISAFEDALRLVGNRHSRRFLWLEDLSQKYWMRYGKRGSVDDLTSAVSTLDQAVQAIPEHHTNRAYMLKNLGEMLDERFQRLGDLEDLNRSIEVLQVACTLSPPWELTPESYYVHPSVKLNLLGVSLFYRAQKLGDRDDLLRSISLFQNAIDTSVNDQKLIALHNIARAKSLLFERNNDIKHLNQAITTLEKAERLSTTRSDPAIKSNLRTTLGHLLRLRFSRDHNTDDINNSISLLERVVSDATSDSEAATYAKIQLAGSFLRRFDHRSRDPKDLDRSVSIYGNLVEQMPDGDPGKSRLRSNYAAALLERYNYQFEMNLLNEDDDIKEAIRQYCLASISKTGPALVRFRASFLCAKFLRSVGSETLKESILSAYGNAIRITPELAWLGLSVSDRHYNLLRAQAIVRDAASTAIEQSEYVTAVEWLEAGRSVIWSQLLQLRSPMDKLRDEEPHLAEQLMTLSRQLEGVPWSESENKLLTGRPPETKHDVDYHALALQRKNLIEKIQTLSGFEDFFSPRPYSQLERVAINGPVIVLNISDISCDALVVTSKGLRRVIITNFTQKEAIKMYDTLRLLLINNQRSILSNSSRAAKRIPDFVNSSDPNAIFKHILSVLWLRVVEPIVRDLALVARASSNGPECRIWWCLTGHLAFLPIHAAGIYDENAPLGSKLSDFAVSSYTPTLTALLNCHDKHPPRKPQMLVVAQPSAPGLPTLPGTREEAKRIEQCIKTSGLPLSLLIDRSEEEVIKGMEQSSWVHFACHGIQDSVNPTQSALILKGGVCLTLSKISQLSLSHAELAFLSACQTATGDEVMSEEAVHLAAGMLLAGYRGVIATMWSIMDNEAPQVANEVYRKFFEERAPNSLRTAHFLHAAVQKLRVEGKSFLSWVPFVHYGF